MITAKKSTRARILFIAPLPPPLTGQSTASYALYEDLKRHRLSVSALNLSKQSFRSGFNSIGRLLEIVLVIVRVIVGRFSTNRTYFTVAESVAGNIKDLLIYICLIGRLDTTYIHLHGGAGMRLLLSHHHHFLLFINGIFLKRLGGVIVLGKRLATIYEQVVPPDRLHVVKNFAPDDVFISLPKLREKVYPKQRIRILYLSNLLPGKGYTELVAAIKLLPISILSRLQIDFAGGFENETDRCKFFLSVKDIRQVKYHGIVSGEQKRQLLEHAHIFCLPTYYRYEGQPISILEAYASGCTVITTDHSGIYDIFSPGINGFSVDKKSPESIAAAIELLLMDLRQLRRFCVLNLRTARCEYRVKKHLEELRVALNLNLE
jgi:glycosyltransferase involved in cell wall biosynthesis